MSIIDICCLIRVTIMIKRLQSAGELFCIYALIGTHSLLSLQVAPRSIQCSRHSSHGGCAYLHSKSTCLRAIMGTVGVSLFATFTQSIHGKPYLQFQCQSILVAEKQPKKSNLALSHSGKNPIMMIFAVNSSESFPCGAEFVPPEIFPRGNWSILEDCYHWE